MKLSLIAAQSRNRVIGKNNHIPWHLPADLRYFKQITMGKPIVMGRKTFDSIGRALPGRRNIVITRQSSFAAENCEVFHSIDTALHQLQNETEVMMIGGAELYAQCMDRADYIYLTVVEMECDGDAFFPIVNPAQWTLSSEEIFKSDEKNQYGYRFQVWKRTK